MLNFFEHNPILGALISGLFLSFGHIVEGEHIAPLIKDVLQCTAWIIAIGTGLITIIGTINKYTNNKK